MNGKLADVYMSVGKTTMNRELIDIHRRGLPMEYLQRGLPMEYQQRLKYDTEEQEFKNRCFNEFLYYSEREEHGGNRNKVLDCETVCLKRAEGDLKRAQGDECDMPQSLRLKQHRIENSDEIRNHDLLKAHKNCDWKQWSLEGVSEDMKGEGCSDFGNRTSSNDYKFMNGGGFSKGRPDLTLSLCGRDRQEIGCRPEDKHKPSYSYTPHQVSDFYVS